jgi:hypothetical protein
MTLRQAESMARHAMLSIDAVTARIETLVDESYGTRPLEAHCRHTCTDHCGQLGANLLQSMTAQMAAQHWKGVACFQTARCDGERRAIEHEPLKDLGGALVDGAT